ncbi:hypothetical protein EKH55_4692 [Sinorhizobium alkalisoli]|nr:hypothetical protein EKH55_4692 [Sinorhizobium alkalisoli]
MQALQTSEAGSQTREDDLSPANQQIGYWAHIHLLARYAT